MSWPARTWTQISPNSHAVFLPDIAHPSKMLQLNITFAFHALCLFLHLQNCEVGLIESSWGQQQDYFLSC